MQLHSVQKLVPPVNIHLINYLSVILVVYSVLHVVQPSITNAVYSSENKLGESFDFPLDTYINERNFRITADLYTWIPQLGKYKFMPDDCLNKITINNRIVATKKVPFCDLSGRSIEIGKYLRYGWNEIAVEIINKGGYVRFNTFEYTSYTIAQILLVLTSLGYSFAQLMFGSQFVRIFATSKPTTS